VTQLSFSAAPAGAAAGRPGGAPRRHLGCSHFFSNRARLQAMSSMQQSLKEAHSAARSLLESQRIALMRQNASR
jgi:hypothetical protein